MSEERATYCTGVLKPNANSVTLSTEIVVVQQKLRDLKRQLIGVLTTVDVLLGDEPSVKTRAERRQGQHGQAST